MADREPVAWFTVNGMHIPIFDGESKEDAFKRSQMERSKKEADNRNAEIKSHYKFHAEQSKKLESDKYESGTYDINTLKPVSFDSGYQFTFSQIGDNYSEEEYNSLVSGTQSKIDDKTVYAGKFEGTPEISFYTKDKNFAMEIGRRYNQISIWDWGACDEIKTGGTGRRK